MAIFKGAGVAIITPMHEDGSVNYENWRKFWSFRLLTVRMLSLSVEQPANHLQ